MGLIINQLKREEKKKVLSIEKIKALSKLCDKKELTFKEWRDSGRFMDRRMFEAEHGKIGLNQRCTDVIVYFGDIYIQALKGDTFFISPDFNVDKLAVAEEELYKENSEKFFS